MKVVDDEIYGLSAFDTAYSGNALPRFSDNLSVPSRMVLDSLTLEDGTDRLSRKIDTEIKQNVGRNIYTSLSKA